MKWAFSKPTPDQDSFERLLREFRREGYEGLQLKMQQFRPFVDDSQEFLERWGDDKGRVSALIHFDTLDRPGQDRLGSTIRFAEATGAERVVFCHNHPHEGVTPRDLVGFARTLSAFGRDATDRGVALSLHHHYEQPVMHPDDFDTFFGAVESGSVGLTIDTAHLAKSGIVDIPAIIHRYADVIDNVHLKDYEAGEWRLLGEGSLDLKGILAALREIGFAKWLCVDEESSADLDAGLRASAAWLDSHC